MVQIQTLGEGEGEQQRTPRMPQGSAPTLPDFAQAAAAVGEAASETYDLIKAGSDKLIIADLERQYTEEKTNAMKFANNLALEAEKLPAKNAVEYFDHHMKEYDEELASRGFAPMVRDKLKEYVSEYTVDKGMAVQASAFRRAKTEQEEAWKVQGIGIVDAYRQHGNMWTFFRDIGDLNKDIANSSQFATPDQVFLAQREVTAELVGEFVNTELDNIKGQTGQGALDQIAKLQAALLVNIDGTIINKGAILEKLREESARAITEVSSQIQGNVDLVRSKATQIHSKDELLASALNLDKFRNDGGTNTTDNRNKDAEVLLKGYLRNLELPINEPLSEQKKRIEELQEFFAARGVVIDVEKLFNNELKNREKKFKDVAEETSALVSNMLDKNSFSPNALVALIQKTMGRTDIVHGGLSNADILDMVLEDPLLNQTKNLQFSSTAREKTERLLQVYKTFNVASDKQGEAQKALDTALESGPTEAERVVEGELETIGRNEPLVLTTGMTPFLTEERLKQIYELELGDQLYAAEAYAAAGQPTGFVKKYYAEQLTSGTTKNITDSMRRISRRGGDLSKMGLGRNDTPLGLLASLAETAAPNELDSLGLNEKLRDMHEMTGALTFVQSIMSGTLDTVRTGALSNIAEATRMQVRKSTTGVDGDGGTFLGGDINLFASRLAYHLVVALDGKANIRNLSNLETEVLSPILGPAMEKALESMEIHNKEVTIAVAGFGYANLDKLTNVNDDEKLAIKALFDNTLLQDDYLISHPAYMTSTNPQLDSGWQGKKHHPRSIDEKKVEIYEQRHLLNETMMDVHSVYPDAILDLQNFTVSEYVQKDKKTLIIPLTHKSGEVFGYLAYDLDTDPNTAVPGSLSPIQIPDQNEILRESNGVVSADMKWQQFEEDSGQRLDHLLLEGMIKENIKIDQSRSNNGQNLNATGQGQQLTVTDAIDRYGAEAIVALGLNSSLDARIDYVIAAAERHNFTIYIPKAAPANTGTTP